MSARARIVVHSLADARAALEAAAALDRPVTLVSAPGAGCATGPRWFLALIAEARTACPAADADTVLDCADEPGMVLAALRSGTKRVRFTGRDDVRRKLVEIAAGSGAAIEYGEFPALDLLDAADPTVACRAYLEDGGATT